MGARPAACRVATGGAPEALPVVRRPLDRGGMRRYRRAPRHQLVAGPLAHGSRRARRSRGLPLRVLLGDDPAGHLGHPGRPGRPRTQTPHQEPGPPRHRRRRARHRARLGRSGGSDRSTPRVPAPGHRRRRRRVPRLVAAGRQRARALGGAVAPRTGPGDRPAGRRCRARHRRRGRVGDPGAGLRRRAHQRARRGGRPRRRRRHRLALGGPDVAGPPGRADRADPGHRARPTSPPTCTTRCSRPWRWSSAGPTTRRR